MNTYEQLRAEASDATDRASNYPNASNHRRAASKHLAAAVHARLLGKDDEVAMHDEKAQEHIDAMKACAGGSAD